MYVYIYFVAYTHTIYIVLEVAQGRSDLEEVDLANVQKVDNSTHLGAESFSRENCSKPVAS